MMDKNMFKDLIVFINNSVIYLDLSTQYMYLRQEFGIKYPKTTECSNLLLKAKDNLEKSRMVLIEKYNINGKDFEK